MFNKKLFAVLLFGIFLISFISAFPTSLLFPTQATQSAGQSVPSGAVINITSNPSYFIVQRNTNSTGTTASLYWRTGVATGNFIENQTFDGSGNATFTQIAKINTTGRDYIIVVSTPAGTYTRSENGSIGTFYSSGTTNGQVKVWANVRLTTSEFTDQAENLFGIYTDNSTAPNINLYSPVAEYNTTSTTNYLVANVTENGATIQNVSLLINGTINQTNTSAFSGAYNFTVALPLGYWNWSILSYSSQNDVKTASRNINILGAIFINQSYTPFVIERTTQNYSTYFTVANGLNVSSVNLTYNQTNYSATFQAINSTSYYSTTSLVTPEVNANTNITFNWTVFFTDGSKTTSSNNQQQVQNFGIDACVSNTIMIFNFTLYDESLVTPLNATGDNTSISVNINFYPNGSKSVPAFSFSNLYNKTLPARVCINSSLVSSVFFIYA